MSPELSQRFNLLGARIDILCLGLIVSTKELKDDSVNHIRPCRCGRALTRNGMCAICYVEEMRREQLKP